MDGGVINSDGGYYEWTHNGQIISMVVIIEVITNGHTMDRLSHYQYGGHHRGYY